MKNPLRDIGHRVPQKTTRSLNRAGSKRQRHGRSPLVSIVVPLHNNSRYVRECLESVLKQTVQDFEILVVNDCSDDDGPSRVALLQKQHGKKIRLFHSKAKSPVGAGAARNIGIRNAKGRFIAFLDADDVWHPFLLERQLAILQSNPEAGFVYACMECIDDEGRPSNIRGGRTVGKGIPFRAANIFENILEENIVPTCTVVVPSDAFNSVGMFFESSKRNFEDWSLWCRLAFRYQAYFVPEVLARYRIGHPSQSRDLAENRGHLEAEREWLLELFPHLMTTYPERSQFLEPLLRKQVARFMFRARSWGATTSEIDLLTQPIGEHFSRLQRFIKRYSTTLRFVPWGAARILRRFRRFVLQKYENRSTGAAN